MKQTFNIYITVFQHLQSVERFLIAGGSKCILFFYQDLPMPPLEGKTTLFNMV